MSKKECPSCAMEIDEESRTCPICGYEFPEVKTGYKWIAIVLLLLFLLMIIYNFIR
jgi:RNA polymerase subunit RPABC4/transcription elongation factor Spt4